MNKTSSVYLKYIIKSLSLSKYQLKKILANRLAMGFESTFISVANNYTVENSSWIYLVDWILALILGLAFIFYFDRLIGLVTSLTLKLILWQRYKIRINAESLRVSFLGGRIFVKNLTIITANQTVSILQLNLTWRYWILFKLTRLSEYYYSNASKESVKTAKEENEKLPARFTLVIDGLEIFMYNRTPAYDSMMDILREKESKNKNEEKEPNRSKPLYEKPQHVRPSHSNSSSSKENASNSDSRKTSTSLSDRPQYCKDDSSHTELSLLFFLKLLPLSVHIRKGAFVLGNATTPSILVASYKQGNGIIDISLAASVLDKFRFLYNFDYEKFQVAMKPNITYDKNRYSDLNNFYSSAKRKHNETLRFNHQKKYRQWYYFQQAINSVSGLIQRPFIRKKELLAEPDDPYQRWKGLKRYVGDLTEGQDLLGNMNTDEEYAKYSLILDSASTRITYYYDSPGITPLDTDSIKEKVEDPEFGVAMELSLATIHYGPWADRQRVPLQTMFFPSLSRDSKPTEGHNVPGKLRSYGGFQFLMTVKDDVIFRVPTREPSKHTETLKKQNQANIQSTSNKVTRPFGWLEINMKEGSSIHSFNSYVATKDDGWKNRVQANFNSFEVRSSVNHDVLFMADKHSIDCNVGFPLEWDGKCNWIFDNISDNGRFFFLREHTMLLSDILTDFASGPSTPYELFRPFHYKINFKFNGYKLFLNVNDKNIINNPLDFSNNKYLSFQGEDLMCEISIPMYGQFRKSTTIEYKINTSVLSLVLDTPQWHTAGAFMKSNLIGKSRDFTIEGSYTYFSQVEVNTSNYIVFKVLGDYVTLKSYGFLVRYLFVLRENYVGENMHFKTFEEYSNDATADVQTEDSSSDILESDSERLLTKETDIDYWKMIKTENDVDILFIFQVRHGLLLLPCNLYDCSSHIGLKFDSFDIDMRFTNSYSDLQADFSPISVVYIEGDNEDDGTNIIFDIPKYSSLISGKQDMSIDGLTIHTHRMFGLPPKEVTYYSKWDFATEIIDINSDGVFILAVSTALRTFAFGFKDMENGINTEFPVIPNAGNFAFSCPQIHIKLKPEKACTNSPYFLIELDSILVSFNDLANDRYSGRISVSIPLIVLKIISESTSDEKILGFLETSLILDNIIQKDKFSENRKIQQEFIRENDAPYHRCPFILYDEQKDDVYNNAYGCIMTPLSLIDASYPLNKNSCFKTENPLYRYEPINRTSMDTESLFNDFENSNKMRPNIVYKNEDFFPCYKMDPKSKYDNIVFDVGEILSFLTPLSLIQIARLLKSTTNYSLSTLMDDLQIEVVHKLKLLILSPSIVDNIRFVTQEINFKFGEFDVSDPLEVFRKSPKVPIFNVNILEPSLAFSKSTGEKKEDQILKDASEMTAALHTKEVFFSVSKPSEFISPIHLNIKDIEFWQTKDIENNSVWSLDVDSVDSGLYEPQVEWLIDYLNNINNLISPAIEEFKKIAEAKKKFISELVYQVSTAGRDFHIDHDPGVLTKPASVLRSQRDHIRFFDSWKVMTRLRHIFENLPEQWLQEKNASFKNFDWEAPENAYDIVLDIFSQWRSWEVNIQKSYFFNSIFAKRLDVYGVSKDINLQVRIKNTNATLMGTEGLLDFVGLQDLTVTYSHVLEIFKDLTRMNLGVIETMLHTDFIFNLESYKSKISPLTLGLYPRVHVILSKLNALKSSRVDTDDSISRNLKNYGLGFIINVNTFQQDVCLPFANLKFRGFCISSTGQLFSLIESPDLIPFNISGACEAFDFQLGTNEVKLISTEIEEFGILVANFGPLQVGTKFVDALVKKCNIRLLDEHNSFCESLCSIIEHDIRYLEELLSFNKDKELASVDHKEPKLDVEESLFEKIGSFSIELKVNHFFWFVDFLFPLKLRGIVYDNHLSWHYLNKSSIFKSFIQKIDIAASINKTPIMEFQNSQILTSIKLCKLDDHFAISTSSSLGYTKLFAPEIVKTFELLIANQELLEIKIKKLGDISKDNPNKELKEGLNHGEGILKKVAFKSKFTNDYIGISTFVDRTKASFELEGVSFGVYNVAETNRSGKSNVSIVPLNGELSVPTARISIVDSSIPVGLSNALDINLCIKIFNDNENPYQLQSLQIESQFCRICLSPQLIFKVIRIVDKLTVVFSKVPESFTEHKYSHNSHTGNAYENVSNRLFQFSAIHVLCYNFCLGWLFGESSKEYPGIIVGAERFFAVTEDDIGKFTLIDAYLAVANGPKSANFYSSPSEKRNLNSASLPNMQMIYTIEEIEGLKHMRMNMYGDELDVKFVSDSIVILEYGATSVSRVQNFLKQRAKPPTITKKNRGSNDSDYIKSIHSTFASIEIIATFAGSNVLLYRLGEGLETPPSLYLHSPAVKIATMYKNQKQEDKKYIIKSEIMTSSSDNTLYATCVPVVMDIIQGVKMMMRKSNSENPQVTRKPVEESPKEFDFGDVLSDVDLHIGLRVESQKLSLSCEPTAKVATIVGINGIYIQINTGSGKFPTLNSTIQFDSISASLQHIYSREISGSVGMRRIFLTNSVKFDQVLSILSSGSFTDVDAYINVKQFQDLNLFKDIWFPKAATAAYFSSGEHKGEEIDETTDKSALASNENISSRFKEVSTTYALPWVLTFMIFNVSLQVDFGQSLGNFVLKLDKFWAVSKKSTDWAQDLKLGVNSISLISAGRLSGILNINSIFLHTAISWKLDPDTTLDVPLILVSGGIDNLQLKLSFDYHVFAIANIQGYSIDIFNQKSELSISKDHLFVTTKFESAELYITSLTASNVLDIYHSISRMIQENKNSYKETLRDSSRGKSMSGNTVQRTKRTASNEILETVKKLETKIEFVAGNLLIHIYPSSFADSKVLVVTLDESKANFQQNEYARGISNQLDIQFNHLKVSLSMANIALEDFILRCSVGQFVEHARKAAGGTIFVFPSFKISMKTFQKYQSNLIEYLYQSSFGDKVDIRWNLGSIIFIREMFAIHKKALASRTEYNKSTSWAGDDPQVLLNENASKGKGSDYSKIKKSLNDDDPTGDIDQAINDTINKVSLHSRYSYLPLVPPIIEAPQLRELGDATPPLEWFGLHRNKFPNVTHQLGIVSLQRLIHEVELQYSKILGKA